VRASIHSDIPANQTVDDESLMVNVRVGGQVCGLGSNHADDLLGRLPFTNLLLKVGKGLDEEHRCDVAPVKLPKQGGLV
jgi:hypothetical protein